MQNPTAARRKTFAMVLSVLAVVVLANGSARAQSYWFETYERAVTMVDTGRLAEAMTLLDQVTKDHPLPVVGLRVPGDRFIDYLPCYQSARIQVARGDFQAATQSLNFCEGFATYSKGSRTAKDIAALRKRIPTTAAAKTAEGGGFSSDDSAAAVR